MLRRTISGLLAVIFATSLSVQPVAASDGPQLVRDLGPNEQVQTFLSIGDRILFTADDGVRGRELFVSDGTHDGTHLVKDIRPGSGSSLLWSSGSDNPNDFTRLGNRGFFLATDGGNGIGLYVSDGTTAGTKRLMRRRPCGPQSKTLVPAATRLLFAAEDAAGTCNLYSTDGTVAGTTLVVAGIPAFRQPRFLHGRVYFLAGPSAAGELWKSDAVVGGTTQIVATFGQVLGQMTVSGQWLYFSVGVVGGSNTRLWKTDGTTARTKPVAPAEPVSPTVLTDLNGKLVFVANRYLGSGVWDKSLWRSNGTTAGTKSIKHWGTDRFSGVSTAQVAGDRIYMFAGEDEASYGLWITDGTAAGTDFVSRSYIHNIVRSGPNIYGMGCYRDGTPVTCEYGHLLMTSDGTPRRNASHRRSGQRGAGLCGRRGYRPVPDQRRALALRSLTSRRLARRAR